MAKTANKKASASKSGSSSGSKSGAKSGSSKSASSKSASSKSSSGRSSGSKSSSSSSGSSNQGPLLEKLFIDQLKDIYYAEKALVRTLPKMMRAATSQELKTAFEQHTEVTKGQVARLEQVFEGLGKKAQGKRCEAMEGLIKEADSMIQDTEKGTMTRDVGLIISAQKVEHYEIASYGSLATLARTLGNEEAKNLLGETLEEEKMTDELLTGIAENNANQQAEQEGDGEESGGQR